MSMDVMLDNTLRCYALTLDPLHIGASGYHLARVDNSIVREPGTGLPKLPASSIAGACRNYAIYALPDEKQRKAAKDCVTKRDEEDQSKPAKDRGNCGGCAICQTFGFTSPDKGNRVGRVKFFDGRLLAFPVRTMVGPVWVTTVSLLRDAGCVINQEPGDDTLVINFALAGNREEPKKLNLGWLYFDTREDNNLALPEIPEIPPELGRRLALAPEWLFAEIVNNNLEVRTSLGIDFATGAARPGAFFTYEAIPRTALFTFDVMIDATCCATDEEAARVKQIVTGGFALFATLGMGAMTTRGLGRVKIAVTEPLPCFEEEPDFEEGLSLEEKPSLDQESNLEEESSREEEPSLDEASSSEEKPCLEQEPSLEEEPNLEGKSNLEGESSLEEESP
jgi:CRISPR-associated protein Cmr4